MKRRHPCSGTTLLAGYSLLACVGYAFVVKLPPPATPVASAASRVSRLGLKGTSSRPRLGRQTCHVSMSGSSWSSEERAKMLGSLADWQERDELIGAADIKILKESSATAGDCFFWMTCPSPEMRRDCRTTAATAAARPTEAAKWPVLVAQPRAVADVVAHSVSHLCYRAQYRGTCRDRERSPVNQLQSVRGRTSVTSQMPTKSSYRTRRHIWSCLFASRTYSYFPVHCPATDVFVCWAENVPTEPSNFSTRSRYTVVQYSVVQVQTIA